jgi:hypothetical protein
MREKQLSVRERRLKVQRSLMVWWVICFFVMPVILWNEWKTISTLGTATLAVCVIGYVVFGGGFFILFLRRYKRVTREQQNDNK